MRTRSPSASELIISYLTLRKAIGWIGVLLPIVLIAGQVAFFARVIPGSVSDYYYTHMRNIFVGSLCAIGVFLLSYEGYDDWDERITGLAGLCAIGTAFSPTIPPAAQVLTTGQQVVGDLHLSFAALTFTALAVMSFRFTKTYPEVTPTGHGLVWRVLDVLGLTGATTGAALTPGKRTRNRIYRICGISIVASLALAVLSLALPHSIQHTVPFVYIFESTAIIAFGLSWFVKGEGLSRFLPSE
ncbi:MAG: hypothetical protein ACYCVZ_18555 [Streptosporangiaceae bacterium]